MKALFLAAFSTVLAGSAVADEVLSDCLTAHILADFEFGELKPSTFSDKIELPVQIDITNNLDFPISGLMMKVSIFGDRPSPLTDSSVQFLATIDAGLLPGETYSVSEPSFLSERVAGFADAATTLRAEYVVLNASDAQNEPLSLAHRWSSWGNGLSNESCQ